MPALAHYRYCLHPCKNKSMSFVTQVSMNGHPIGFPRDPETHNGRDKHGTA